MEYFTVPKGRGVLYASNNHLYVKKKYSDDRSSMYLKCSKAYCPATAKIVGELLHVNVSLTDDPIENETKHKIFYRKFQLFN